MVKRVTGSFGALLADAQERGHVGQNVVRSLRANRKRGKERKAERRAKGKLKIGVDIPTPEEIDALLGAATGLRWRAFFLTTARCGLRASELRGLRWIDIDFKKGELHVRQRADAYNEIGNPKSEDGERTIPIPPTTLQALREWKLACPRRDGELHFVFPNGSGNVEAHSNIITRGLIPTWRMAGVTAPVVDDEGKPARDEKGKPVVTAKYTGLHALRHFFASWCVNRRADGGLELPLKIVSERLGHSNIAITADLYSHLFPRGDDAAELAAAEGKFG
jgi:integrase